MNGLCFLAYAPAVWASEQGAGRSSMYAFQEIPAVSSWSARLGASTLQPPQSLVIPWVSPLTMAMYLGNDGWVIAK